jgi:nucleotide-binding universal stress UspA family protein
MDRSAVSGTALATLGTFAELGNLEMEIAVLRSSHDDDFLEEPSIRAQEVTERVREWIGASPAEVHVRDLAEAPARGFLELAGERAAGLLVTGTHQRHGLERLRAPSFSRVILTHGATNVLCVPARAATAIESLPRLQRILVGTDFGASWPDVLRYAKALLPGGGAIHVVHVCPEPKAGINPLIRSAVYFDHCLEIVEIRERAERRIRELPAALRACDGVTLTWEVIANDDVAGALCAEAERVGAGVICLETDRASRLVTSVIDQASVPVFVVKYPIP